MNNSAIKSKKRGNTNMFHSNLSYLAGNNKNVYKVRSNIAANHGAAYPNTNSHIISSSLNNNNIFASEDKPNTLKDLMMLGYLNNS